MATLAVNIIQDAVKGTTEFQRLCDLDLIETKVLDSCFEVLWNPNQDDLIFDVFSGSTHFIIGYKEIDSGVYPTPLDYYNYLESLSICGAGNVSIATQKITEQLETRQELTYVDLTLSSGTPWVGFPLTVTQVNWTDGVSPAVSINISATVVNDTAELAAVFNANIPNNQLSVRDATSVFILAGTVDIPTSLAASIGFDAAPNVLTYPKPSSWNTELDAEKSSVNLIEEKVTQLADGGESLIAEEFPILGIASGNNAQSIAVADNSRENIFIQVHTLSAWVRLKSESSVPANREGYLIKAGGDINISTLANGQKYLGAVSIINAVDGEVPTYSFSVLKRP